jgi:integrase
MGLGSADLFSLAEARQKAFAAKRLVAEKIDPLERRKAQVVAADIEAAKAITFRQCAEAYIASRKWKNPKHARQWPSTLEAYVHPVFGDLPVQAIDKALITKALDPIWLTKTETASRVRGRIETILNWAAGKGYREEGPNPARWKGHLENVYQKKSEIRPAAHHAALPYAQLADFMTELRQQGGIAARALEFAILTCARTGEVLGTRWDEIDFKERTWVVPAQRMKTGKEHRSPLSAPALSILEAMEEIRQGDFVFSGGRAGRPLSNMAFLMLLRRMGRGDLTAHGFRSTFSDWCAEKTNTPSEVREMALAHAVGDKVEAAYRRGDLFEKRRQLAEEWANYATPQSGDNVVPITAAAR